MLANTYLRREKIVRETALDKRRKIPRNQATETWCRTRVGTSIPNSIALLVVVPGIPLSTSRKNYADYCADHDACGDAHANIPEPGTEGGPEGDAKSCR